MSYSANDNQNFFVQDGRTTSRVLNRPGGNCSISLGGWTEEELEQQRRKREEQERKVTAAQSGGTIGGKVGDNQPPSEKENDDDDDDNNNNTSGAVVVVDGVVPPAVPTTVDVGSVGPTSQTVVPPMTTKPGISSNAFASSSTTNSFNVLTDRPTSRVTRPPGGHTSIRLG